MIKFIIVHLKDVVFIVVFLLSSVFGIIAYKNMTQQLEQAHTDFKNLSDTVARASNDFASKKDLKQFAADLQIDLAMMQNDMSRLGANLMAVGSAVAQIKASPPTIIIGHAGEIHEPPVQPTVCLLCDIHKYTLQVQTADVTLMGLPVAHLTFDASKPLKTAWTQSTDLIEITTDTVVGQKEKSSELVFYHETKLKNVTLNKEVKLPIVSAAYKQIPPSNHFYFWAPSFNIGIAVILTLSVPLKPAFGGLLDFGIMGYGRSMRDLEWEFISLGGGYGGNGWFLEASPVKYNLGYSVLPIITNLWIGPSIVWDASWGIGLSLTARI